MFLFVLGKILEKLKRINKENYDVDSVMKGEVKMHMLLTPEQFNAFIDWLYSIGYINVNGAVNRVTDYVNYKEDYIIDEFVNLKKGNKVTLEYIRVKAKDEAVVLKSIKVE